MNIVCYFGYRFLFLFEYIFMRLSVVVLIVVGKYILIQLCSFGKVVSVSI